jgi:hypothetical protein
MPPPPSADIEPEKAETHYSATYKEVHASSSQPVVLDIMLPHTVGDVKSVSTQNTLFRHKKLPDDYAFKHWCVFIPHPESANPSEDDVSALGSSYLISQRHVVGGAIPDNSLLVTFVTKGGEIDVALGAEITRALGYRYDQSPILIFTPMPRIRVYQTYKNIDSINQVVFKDQEIDGVAVSLGGASRKSLRSVVKIIPDCFTEKGIKLDELIDKVRLARGATARNQKIKQALKVGAPAVSVLAAIGKIILG